jgi:hypothetical protein
MQIIGELCIKYGINMFKNCGGPFLQHIFGRCFTKNPFLELRKWKIFFCAKKIKTPKINIVCHPKMHTCAQYGVILTNYAMIVIIP